MNEIKASKTQNKAYSIAAVSFTIETSVSSNVVDEPRSDGRQCLDRLMLVLLQQGVAFFIHTGNVGAMKFSRTGWFTSPLTVHNDCSAILLGLFGYTERVK